MGHGARPASAKNLQLAAFAHGALNFSMSPIADVRRSSRLSQEQTPRQSLSADNGYTKESFGNWFKGACVTAGLMHHNGHGLRKATLRRLAELQAANKTMKALSGQEKDETLAIYTADADQIRLADEAVTMLARWEMKAKKADRHGEYRFTAND
jgi:hypothetical protein